MIRTLNDPLGASEASAINPRAKQSEPTDAKKASVGSTGLSVFAKTLSQVLYPFQPDFCFEVYRSMKHE